MIKHDYTSVIRMRFAAANQNSPAPSELGKGLDVIPLELSALPTPLTSSSAFAMPTFLHPPE